MTAALDAAHAAMEADPGDEAARRRWFGRLLDTELAVVLETEAQGSAVTPRIFALEAGPVVLAYDGEDRLAAAFAQALPQAALPYAALPGRVLVAALAGQGAGLGVNLGAAAPFLMDAAAVDWLAAALAAAPELDAARADFGPPPPLPPDFLEDLALRLAPLAGPGVAVWLAAVGAGPVVVVAGLAPAAGAQVARTVAEAAAFGGLGAGVAVAVLSPGAAVPGAVLRHGLALGLPPTAVPPDPPRAPGPPRLR